jgi:hypothetical protein
LGKTIALHPCARWYGVLPDGGSNRGL